ncbi:MAG: hypothetical protein IPM78_11985 [Moraxellaceae bacterium]|nr:hypothetical protein [Moraxellaceae bacterium]
MFLQGCFLFLKLIIGLANQTEKKNVNTINCNHHFIGVNDPASDMDFRRSGGRFSWALSQLVIHVFNHVLPPMAWSLILACYGFIFALLWLGFRFQKKHLLSVMKFRGLGVIAITVTF